MTVESELQAILRDSEDDEPRRHYAKSVSISDPDYAEFISLQLNRASKRRTSLEFALPSEDEKDLLERNHLRWSQGLDGFGKSIEFDRGFPVAIRVEPQVFLTHGEELFERAPIRHLSLKASPGSEPFPLRKIVASPLLERLDVLYLKGLELTDADIEVIVEGGRLSRCLAIDLSFNPIGFASFVSLAQSPSTKSLLLVFRGGGSSNSYHPGQQLHAGTTSDWSPMKREWAPLGEDGRSLERQFGYLPWLHPQDHECSRFDLRWFVQQGIFPKKPPGSPVEQ